MMDSSVIMLSIMELIGVLPPVVLFTLLRP